MWIKKSVLTTSVEAFTKFSYQVDIPQVKREFPLVGKSEYLILPFVLGK